MSVYKNDQSRWIFLIDTDSYAGNFEREMTAYCTGAVGNCEVGQEFAEQFTKEEPAMIDGFSLEYRSDDSGGNRPTSIWIDDNGKPNSVAIFFETKPSKEQIELIVRRAMNFASISKWSKPIILGFRMLREETRYYNETV